jgi:hypothetical protein
MPARDQADEISLEELEAAGEMFDILVSVGWKGYLKWQEEALAWLAARSGLKEASVHLSSPSPVSWSKMPAPTDSTLTRIDEAGSLRG